MDNNKTKLVFIIIKILKFYPEIELIAFKSYPLKCSFQISGSIELYDFDKPVVLDLVQ